MALTWTVNDAKGPHQIEYKRGKLIIDGNQYKLKSSNWFIQLIDYAFNFDDGINVVNCHLVVIGSKVDLAVNGVYLESQKPYEPISNIPPLVSVFAGISAVLGFLMNGWLGICIGILFGVLYFNTYLKKKSLTPIIIIFAAVTVFQIILGIVVSLLLAPLY